MLCCICFGWSPLSQRESGSSSQIPASHVWGRGSSLSGPPDLTQLAGLMVKGVRTPAAQANNRRAEAGTGTGTGTPRGAGRSPDPALQQSPVVALPDWGMGLEAGASLPGRSAPLRLGLAPEEGGRLDAVVGRARYKPCEQDPRILTAPSPSAPFPGPSPPGTFPSPRRLGLDPTSSRPGVPDSARPPHPAGVRARPPHPLPPPKLL